MKQSDIKNMSTTELLSAFYWVGVRVANEANSKGNITKKTEKEEAWLVAELSKRFDLDPEELNNRINL